MYLSTTEVKILIIHSIFGSTPREYCLDGGAKLAPDSILFWFHPTKLLKSKTRKDQRISEYLNDIQEQSTKTFIGIKISNTQED